MPIRIISTLFAILLAVTASANSQNIKKQQVEARAIWLDAASIPKDQDGIKKLVAQIRQANLNIIMPEVIHRGYTIYPSKVTQQESKWIGCDPLAALIKQAHKYGIEVHPWVHVFRQGYEKYKGPILTAHPGWTAKNKSGEELSANGGYWICPSEPAARDYLSALFTELVTRYDVDGLHLDYIRFENQSPVPYCYNDTCRTGFRNEYGIDPLDIDPFSPNQIAWHLWRERQINTFVQRIATEARKTRPQIKISAAVGADPVAARIDLLQNWVNWADNKWVDFICPMAYTSDETRFTDFITKELKLSFTIKSLISSKMSIGK